MKRRKTCGLQLQPSILCIEVGKGRIKGLVARSQEN
jgi:hypothetical protein